MSFTIPAIFDAGVFRPLQPVDLADGTHVEVQVPVAAPSSDLTPEQVAFQPANEEIPHQFVPLSTAGKMRVRFTSARPLQPLKHPVDDVE